MQKHISSIHLKVGYQKLIEGWIFFYSLATQYYFEMLQQVENQVKISMRIKKKKNDFKVFALGYIAISIHLQPAQQNN